MTFERNYTFSKTIVSGESHMNGYDIGLSKSVADIHIPHRLVFNGVYELPIGKGRRYLSGSNP